MEFLFKWFDRNIAIGISHDRASGDTLPQHLCSKHSEHHSAVFGKVNVRWPFLSEYVSLRFLVRTSDTLSI